MSEKDILELNKDDFGFTFIDKPELQDEKLVKIYEILISLLDKLNEESDTKDYIFWPNRKQKIYEIKKRVNELYGKLTE